MHLKETHNLCVICLPFNGQPPLKNLLKFNIDDRVQPQAIQAFVVTAIYCMIAEDLVAIPVQQSTL
jgi:hypothetical protein